jgi:class 3 adenylate cyclase
MALPTGTVSLLFTDIEGSTRLCDQHWDNRLGCVTEAPTSDLRTRQAWAVRH